MTKIYKITNLINGKSYVGKTSFSIEKRFQEHCQDALRNDREHRPLYSAFNKYGVQNFNIELIEECEDDVSSLREQYWIGFYQTYSNGYNATLGGEGKIKYNHDKIIQALKANPYPKDIAKQFGCCVDIVRYIAKANNIEVRNKGQEEFLKNSVGILQFDKEGKFLNKFPSYAEAARWGKMQHKKIISYRIGACTGRGSFRCFYLGRNIICCGRQHKNCLYRRLVDKWTCSALTRENEERYLGCLPIKL